jgi:hypothetical protein
VGLLNNLRAGRSNAQVGRALDLLRHFPDVVHVETDSAKVLPEALVEFSRQEVDLLVVNGGDGTLQYTLTELLTNPDLARVRMVAPLRGGRTNMTSMDLGAQRDPIAGLRGLLVDAAAGRLADRCIARPVLRVRSNRRDSEQYGMFFGMGMLRRAVQLVHRSFSAEKQGVFGAGLVTAALVTKVFWRPTDGIMAPDKAEVRIDGKSLPDAEFYLLCASSLQRLFLRMNPFWGHGPGGVRFTGMASRARRIPLAAPGILCGRPPGFVDAANGYTSENAEQVELRLGSGFTIDGEIFGPEADELVSVAADRRIQFVRA